MKKFSLTIVKYQTKKGIFRRAMIRESQKLIGSKQGFKTVREAKEWANEEEARIIKRRKLLLSKTGITFLMVSNDFLDYKKNKVSRNTFSAFCTLLRRFLKFLNLRHAKGPEIAPEAISGLFIEEFMEWVLENYKKCSSKVANRHLRDLKSIFKHAIEKGIILGDKRVTIDMKNPCLGVEKLKEKKYVRPVPSSEVVALYRQFAEPGNERDYIDIMCLTLQRGKMIRTLAWEDIQWDTNIATFWHKKGNGELKPVPVLMSPDLKTILKRRFDNRGDNDTHVFMHEGGGRCRRNQSFPRRTFEFIRKRIITQMREETGDKEYTIVKVTGHAFRHWGAHELDKVLPREEIQKQLGHEDLRTTKIYLDDMAVSNSAANTLQNISSGLSKKAPLLRRVK